MAHLNLPPVSTNSSAGRRKPSLRVTIPLHLLNPTIVQPPSESTSGEDNLDGPVTERNNNKKCEIESTPFRLDLSPQPISSDRLNRSGPSQNIPVQSRNCERRRENTSRRHRVISHISRRVTSRPLHRPTIRRQDASRPGGRAPKRALILQQFKLLVVQRTNLGLAQVIELLGKLDINEPISEPVQRNEPRISEPIQRNEPHNSQSRNKRKAFTPQRLLGVPGNPNKVFRPSSLPSYTAAQFRTILTEESGEFRGFSGEERDRFEWKSVVYSLLIEKERLRLEEASQNL